MAIAQYGTSYKKEFVNVPSEKGENGAAGGNVLCFSDEFVVDSTDYIANGESVAMLKIPAGYKFLSCTITDNLTSGAGAFTVGTADDPDGLSASYDTSAVSYKNGEGALLLTETSQEETILLTFTETMAAAVTGEKIRLAVQVVQS